MLNRILTIKVFSLVVAFQALPVTLFIADLAANYFLILLIESSLAIVQIATRFGVYTYEALIADVVLDMLVHLLHF